jgi:hypothetical protein
MLIYFILLLWLTPAYPSTTDHSKGWGGIDGGDFLTMCQAGVELQDGKNISAGRMVDASHCMNYLTGFLDGFAMGQLAPGATEVFCFPEGVNAGQMVRVVAKWLLDHPARLHEPAYGLVFVAIRESFACQSTTEQSGGAALPTSPDSLPEAKPNAASTNDGRQGDTQPSLDTLESLQDAQISAENNKALTDAKEAVRLKPTDGFAWFALGQAYIRLNDYGTAEEPLKRALKAFFSAPAPSDPNDRTTLTMLANTSLALADVCEKLHRKREAEHYRRSAFLFLPAH